MSDQPSSDQLIVLNDLKARFGQFTDIAKYTGDLQTQMAAVNDINANSVGNDPISAQYKGTIKEPMQILTDLIKTIQEYFVATGDSGQASADLYRNTDDYNSQIAGG